MTTAKDDLIKFLSDRGVWQKLADAERQKRAEMGYPAPSSDWGGRNAVGGSSWNDACILSPQEIIAIASCLASELSAKNAAFKGKLAKIEVLKNQKNSRLRSHFHARPL